MLKMLWYTITFGLAHNRRAKYQAPKACIGVVIWAVIAAFGYGTYLKLHVLPLSSGVWRLFAWPGVLATLAGLVAAYEEKVHASSFKDPLDTLDTWLRKGSRLPTPDAGSEMAPLLSQPAST